MWRLLAGVMGALLPLLAVGQTSLAPTTSPALSGLQSPCVDPSLCSYLNPGGGHGECRGAVCICEYAWTGPDCMYPMVNGGNNSQWMLIAVFFGTLVPLALTFVSAVMLVIYVRDNRHKWMARKTFCALTMGSVFVCAFARPFYYTLDPFNWRNTLPQGACSIYGLDYFTTAAAACAYLFLLQGWSAALVKFSSVSSMTGARSVWMRVWGFMPCIPMSALLILLVIPASVTACKCDGETCPETTSDYVFYIPWLILMGLTTIFAMIAAGTFLRALNGVAARRDGAGPSPHTLVRQRRFAVFILLSSVTLVFMIAFGASVLARSEGLSSGTFLVIEGFNAFILSLQLVTVLIAVYQGQLRKEVLLGEERVTAGPLSSSAVDSRKTESLQSQEVGSAANERF